MSPMPKKLSAQARARKIKVLLFDVDGVLTDGKLYFIPDRESNRQGSAELSAQGSIEFKGFHAHDGLAISLARLGALRTGLITKRYSETVALRARDLKLEFVRPFEDTSTSEFTFQPKGDQTVVTWSMLGHKNFISKAMCLFMDMDKMLGGEFEKGLAQMKTVVEQPAGNGK